LAGFEVTLEAGAAAAVQNETAWIPSPFHNSSMMQNKHKSNAEAYASVKKELAKPRMAKSSRTAELNLDITRIPEQPRTSMLGTVNKIIPSPRPSQPENARIVVTGPDRRTQDLRIENTLTDEHGDEVRLKKGAHVEITITARDVHN
jgi:hypothetical protein